MAYAIIRPFGSIGAFQVKVTNLVETNTAATSLGAEGPSGDAVEFFDTSLPIPGIGNVWPSIGIGGWLINSISNGSNSTNGLGSPVLSSQMEANERARGSKGVSAYERNKEAPRHMWQPRWV